MSTKARKISRIVTYSFFLILTAITSVMIGSKRSNTDSSQSRMIPLIPTAQADILSADGGGAADAASDAASDAAADASDSSAGADGSDGVA